ncbi:MAG: ATP synthase F0 subunit B [Calditrichaeota bacterium]|nr:MAG: ATP synthase F0 subunit B [Calditrichota bacterium]
MDLLTPDTGLMFWTVLTFALLYFVLGKFVWKPVGEVLDEREARLNASLEKAEEAQKSAEAALEKNKEMLTEARNEVQELIAKGKKTAESVREDIIAEAKSEATALIDRARKEVNLEQEKALDEIRKLAVDLSISATQKVIGKALSEKEHQQLVSQSFEDLGELN